MGTPGQVDWRGWKNARVGTHRGPFWRSGCPRNQRTLWEAPQIGPACPRPCPWYQRGAATAADPDKRNPAATPLPWPSPGRNPQGWRPGPCGCKPQAAARSRLTPAPAALASSCLSLWTLAGIAWQRLAMPLRLPDWPQAGGAAPLQGLRRKEEAWNPGANWAVRPGRFEGCWRPLERL